MLPPTAHVMSRRAALEWLAEQLAWEQILDELRSGMVDAPNRAA